MKKFKIGYRINPESGIAKSKIISLVGFYKNYFFCTAFYQYCIDIVLHSATNKSDCSDVELSADVSKDALKTLAR